MHIPIYYHKLYLRSTATVSVVANGLLLLLLSMRASRALGNYRFLIGTFAAADILISLFHAWYTPIFVLGEYGFVWFGHGTLLQRSAFVLDANIAYAATFYLPFCLLGLHFIYRYLSLVKLDKITSLVQAQFPRFFSACVVYTTLYVICSSLLSQFGRSRGVPRRFRILLAPYGFDSWSDELNVASVTIVDDNTRVDVPVLLALIAAIVLIGHTLLISLVCIAKISMTFDKLIDIRARRFHVHLFRALLIQFTIPVLTSLVPLSAIFLLPMTGAKFGELGNVFGLLASLYPALDPILIIISISSFRAALQRWVRVLFGSTASMNERHALERSRRQMTLHHSVSMNML